MDLRLFAGILWRFKTIVLAGFVLAVGFATLSVARVSPKGLAYRNPVTWQSTERLGVTGNGFAWGSVSSQDPSARTNGLAVLYAELITSDPVRRLMLTGGKINGQVGATAVATGWSGSIQLPFIDITGISTSPAAAADLASRAATALRTYVEAEQRASHVSSRDRIVLATVQESRAATATIFKGRSKTMPALVFVLVMGAAIGLAFILENVRPRLRRVSVEATPQPEARIEPEARIQRTA